MKRPFALTGDLAPAQLVKRFSPLLPFLVCGTIWELAGTLGWLNPYIVPALSQVLVATLELATGTPTGLAVLQTLNKCFWGLLIAALAMTPFGLILGRSDTLHRLFTPLIELLRPIPSSAMIPIFMALLGLNQQMAIAVVVFGCSWPILLNSISGSRSVDTNLLDATRNLGLSELAIFFKVIFPASLPSVLTGYRISLSVAFILAVTAEMVAGLQGVGFDIIDYERSFRFPQMYGSVLILGLCGVGINLSFGILERHLLAWLRGQKPGSLLNKLW